MRAWTALSVLAYAVMQRTAEIGIRMALGSPRGAVVSLIMRSGLRLVAFGLVVGLAAAAGVAKLIASLLFDVAPLDPLVYGGVAVLFAGVATLACLLSGDYRRARDTSPQLTVT